MDENKLNELFRDILDNKLKVAPPSSHSPSDLTTLDSSVLDETFVDYEDVMRKLQVLVESNINLKIKAKSILKNI